MLNELVLRGRQAVKLMLTGAPRPEAIDPITAEEIAEITGFFPRQKFFIIGPARSGTTLLARLVRLHPEVHCSWQAHFFTSPPLLSALVSQPEVHRWLTHSSNRWNRGDDPSACIMRVVADFMLEREAAAHGASIVGDKSPNNQVKGAAVENLQAVYPDARLIMILRDPRDTLLSHRFHAFLDSPHSLSRKDLHTREDFRQDPSPYLARKRSLFIDAELRADAKHWGESVQATMQLGQELYGERFCTVRFEDLLTDPVGQVGSIWEFLKAPQAAENLGPRIREEIAENPDADWQLQKDESIARWLRKGESGGWRELFTDRDRRAVEEAVGDLLPSLGYGG